MGDNIKGIFTSSSKEYSEFQVFPTANSAAQQKIIDDYNKTEINITRQISETSTIKKNSDGTVDLTLDGNITLKGINININEAAQTAGTAGGTEKVVQIVLQVADQIEVQGNVEDKDIIKELRDLVDKQEKMAGALNKYCNDEAPCDIKNLPDKNHPDEDGFYFHEGDFKKIVKELAEIKKDGKQEGLVKKANHEFEQIMDKGLAEKYPDVAILVESLTSEINDLAINVYNNSQPIIEGLKNKEVYNSARYAREIERPHRDSSSTITDTDARIVCQLGQGNYNRDGCR